MQGEVRKRSEPVFMMDKPWETNVNNGYSSVLYDPEDAFGLGRFRAFYSASDGGFGAADCPPGECGAGSATLVANSTDGISWEKPRLGLFAWSSSKKNRGTLSNATTPLPCCTLCPPGACPCPFCGHAAASETNILFEETTAVAIFDDGAHELNASRRFKVCMTPCIHGHAGVASSPRSPCIHGHAGVGQPRPANDWATPTPGFRCRCQ
eukprot:COSAG01_NODE_11441_length_1934_cov_0.863215_2_plen_209_part_00